MNMEITVGTLAVIFLFAVFCCFFYYFCAKHYCKNMIKELTLINWKSFSNSTLYIDPLTFIIGTNASGKSNILDALSFLCDLANGKRISEAVERVRGGEDWIVRKGQISLTLKVVAEYDSNIDYEYSLDLSKTENGLDITGERLILLKGGSQKLLFEIYDSTLGSPTVDVRFYTAKPGHRRRMFLDRSKIVLSQIDSLVVLKLVKDAAVVVARSLSEIFILNPIPNNMRQYVRLSDVFKNDASNIAGVLAGMDSENKGNIEKKLSDYLRPLPEKDINKVWAEPVGKFGSDAMLYCEEQWTAEETTVLDARGMSDGTLRFIAIVMAILTAKENSLLVIEEVDNGLHPSRSQELVNMLKRLGEERKVDILCTTHNPSLIDKLGVEMIPFICFIKRNNADGSSAIRLLEDKDGLGKLMASNTLGDLMKKDEL